MTLAVRSGLREYEHTVYRAVQSVVVGQRVRAQSASRCLVGVVRVRARRLWLSGPVAAHSGMPTGGDHPLGARPADESLMAGSPAPGGRASSVMAPRPIQHRSACRAERGALAMVFTMGVE